MKILYILHKFLPRYFSGTEVYTYYLAREMKRRGHEIQIFCADNVEVGTDYHIKATDDVYDGLKVHRISYNRKKAPDIIRCRYDNQIVAEHLKSFLFSNPPDVVHITNLLNVSAAIIDPLKKFSLPTIFTATDFWCVCPRGNLLSHDGSLCSKAETKKCLECIINLSFVYPMVLKKLMISPRIAADIFSLISSIPGLKRNSYLKAKKALDDRAQYVWNELKKIDLVIAPSLLLEEFFLEAGFSSEKVVFSGYGINTDRIIPRNNDYSGHPVRFGYMGLLAPLKGVDILIRAFAKIPYPHGASLKIYGDDSHFPQYAQRLKEFANGNPKIFFKEPFPPESVGKILEDIDALVVPSLWYENTPLVISEAFAARIPVIATDVPGISHMVSDNVNGLLFPRGDEAALTQRLKTVVQEPDLLTRLRKNILPVKTITENGDELETLYARLVAERKTY